MLRPRAASLLGLVRLDHGDSLDTHEVSELGCVIVVRIGHVCEGLLAAAHGLEGRDADARAVELPECTPHEHAQQSSGWHLPVALQIMYGPRLDRNDVPREGPSAPLSYCK